MKRFLLFAAYAYEENGGWNDLVGAFDSVVEAALHTKEKGYGLGHWWHVVDTTTMQIVAKNL